MVRKNIIFWIKYTLLLLLYFVVVKFTATFINSELENTLILAEKGEFDLPLITDLFSFCCGKNIWLKRNGASAFL
jgi:hypothetical protein